VERAAGILNCGSGEFKGSLVSGRERDPKLRVAAAAATLTSLVALRLA
jgi:hypothetical protein